MKATASRTPRWVTRPTTRCGLTPVNCAAAWSARAATSGSPNGRAGRVLPKRRQDQHDAIDNSGGVDCSDREVNLKILLDAVVADGDLTIEQRDALLAEVTDDVASLVLRDNYRQSQALANSCAQASSLADVHARYIRLLVQVGKLNRDLEFLPSEEIFTERKAAGQGLTAPELAALLAHTKIAIFDDLLESDVPEDPYLARNWSNTSRLRFTSASAIASNNTGSAGRSSPTSSAMSWSTSKARRSPSDWPTRPRVDSHDRPRPHGGTRRVRAAVALDAVEDVDDRVPSGIQTEILLEGRKLVERRPLGGCFAVAGHRSMWRARSSGSPRALDRSAATSPRCCHPPNAMRTVTSPTACGAPACRPSWRHAAGFDPSAPPSTSSKWPRRQESRSRRWRPSTSLSGIACSCTGARSDRGPTSGQPLAHIGTSGSARRPLRPGARRHRRRAARLGTGRRAGCTHRLLGCTQRRGGAADNAVDRRRQSRWSARTGNSVRGAAREPQPHPDCRRFAARTLIPSGCGGSHAPQSLADYERRLRPATQWCGGGSAAPIRRQPHGSGAVHLVGTGGSAIGRSAS